jgi:hypothetical protein
MSEDEDFLPKDMWTYIHTPITQDFYGFGWMIDNSNDETGPILQHGGTDGHNFAQAILVPRQLSNQKAQNAPGLGLG